MDDEVIPAPIRRGADRLLLVGEQVVYAVAAVCLIGGAGVLLVEAIRTFLRHIDDGTITAATELLSVLLLVFVFVELLGAVRLTMRERRLIAEPFLLVGIIASIKEIVVVAGAERPDDESSTEFHEAMLEIGVLAAVVLVLSISALLLRRREREPSESDE